MANVFKQIGDIKNNVNRSSFDWSHDNNFTTEIGRITPVFTELVPPNTSLSINPAFGLKFMPMMFPIQTKLKAYLSFYKVPLRTLWKDYQDWVSSPNDSTAKYEPPYMAFNPATCFNGKELLGVSGLGDYFDIPIVNPSVSDSPLSPGKLFGSWDNESVITKYYSYADVSNAGASLSKEPSTFSQENYVDYIGTVNDPNDPNSKASQKNYGIYPFDRGFFDINKGVQGNTTLTIGFQGKSTGNLIQSFNIWKRGGNIIIPCLLNINDGIKGIRQFGKNVVFHSPRTDGEYTICEISAEFYFDGSETNDNTELGFLINGSPLWMNKDWNPVTSGFTTQYSKSVTDIGSNLVGSTINGTTSPYFLQGDDEKKKRIKISAYPFRAYEAIYNAYIRNSKNNPFKVGGVAKYNTWLPTQEGGADTTNYELHYANWATDAYTSALPTPQQGKAPLVGLTTYSKTVELDNGHLSTEVGTALVDEDGKKYKVEFESNGEELKNVSYTEMSSETPVKPIHSLYDVVTSGISISDFRNVNAYQRYLELNQFRGYSYKDIIEGRFDVNIRYDALMMPEYIGGITRDVVINPVTQTVETSNDGSYIGALGSQAGDAGVYGTTNQRISVFCDEESIVMGILYVVPMPVYSQILPKYLTYRDRLDSFNPEFANIGFQPIRYSELCPVQMYAQNKDKMLDVFGYQRPWYEYVQKVDKAHGLFRTQLRNFLMNRTFNSVPVLGKDFTVVDPEQVNDVFSVTETTDKIIGQIHFDATAKLPIPRVVVPKLE